MNKSLGFHSCGLVLQETKNEIEALENFPGAKRTARAPHALARLPLARFASRLSFRTFPAQSKQNISPIPIASQGATVAAPSPGRLTDTVVGAGDGPAILG